MTHPAPTLLLTLAPVLLTGPAPAAPSQDDTGASTRGDHVAAARLVRERHGVAAMHPEPVVDVEARAALDRTTLASFRLDDVEALEFVCEVLSIQIGVPVRHTEGAENEVLDAGVVFEFDLRRPTAARTVLDLVATAAGDAVDWAIEDGEIVFETLGDRSRAAFVHLHPIGDLRAVFEPDDVASLVRDLVLPDTWEWDGRLLDVTPVFLVVRQTRDVQVEVERLLARLADLCVAFGGPPALSCAEPGAAESRWAADRAMFDTTTLTPDFEDGDPVGIDAIVDWIGESTQFNVHVRSRLIDEFDEDDLSVRIGAQPLSLAAVLERIERQRPHVRWSILEDTLVFHPRYEYLQDATVEFHDVRAIVQPAPARLAQGITDEPTDELVALVIDPAVLEDLIRSTVLPESWDDDFRNSIRIGESGLLTVTQSPRGHAEVRALLDRLYAVAATMLEAGGHGR